MSIVALQQATVAKLRANVPLKAHECNVTIDRRPLGYQIGRDTHVSVWGSGWGTQNTQIQLPGLDELYEVTITISRLAGMQPQDVWSPEVWEKSVYGIESVARCIMRVMLQDGFEIMCDANQLIQQRAEECGCEPLPQGEHLIAVPLKWQRNDSSPRPAGPDHWVADPDKLTQKPYGLVLDLVYGEARRVQASEVFT